MFCSEDVDRDVVEQNIILLAAIGIAYEKGGLALHIGMRAVRHRSFFSPQMAEYCFQGQMEPRLDQEALLVAP